VLAPPIDDGIGGRTRRQRPVAAGFVNRNVNPFAAAGGGIGVCCHGCVLVSKGWIQISRFRSWSRQPNLSCVSERGSARALPRIKQESFIHFKVVVAGDELGEEF